MKADTQQKLLDGGLAETLFSIFAPLERFAGIVRSGWESFAPPVAIAPLDAYLMHLVSEFELRHETILDLAGSSTFGLSTILWSSRARKSKLVSVLPTSAQEHCWLAPLRDFLASESSTPATILSVPAEPSSLWNALPKLENRTTLSCVALAPGCDPTPWLDAIRRGHPYNVTLILNVGRIGTDNALSSLLNWARESECQLDLFRELHSSLGVSRLGVVYPKKHEQAPEAIARIARLFSGNFDFLTLAHQACHFGQTKARLEEQLRGAQRLLEQERADLNTKLWKAETRLHESETRLYESETKLYESETKLWNAGNKLAEAETARAELQVQLDRATKGRAWALLNRLRRVRQWLFPRGGFRARFAGRILRAFHRLQRSI